MIKKGNTYYLFTTHGDIGIRKSTDRINWAYAGKATPWWGTTDLWAPDVSLHNNTYWLLYAHPTANTLRTAEIYLATSTTLEPGSYKDKGIIIASTESSPYNCIDPSAVQDYEGNWWISFGSWSNGIYLDSRLLISFSKMIGSYNTRLHHFKTLGIYIFKVDSSGKQISTPKRIAARPSTALEGSTIFKHSNKYYLFMSFGNCCPTTTGVVRAIFVIML
ncbi:glycosyl hydrolase [Jimgerdemannia flammicorona]|uniref:Endo-1,5-alpha-L-arabinanase A n=1 Tax=Jimgerdemannia flammicorona TaxID=994334 RepID=A0A433A0X4_9FUNG|nr:glycosyl hydrolase [Jimgerdemannia flammicorona]